MVKTDQKKVVNLLCMNVYIYVFNENKKKIKPKNKGQEWKKAMTKDIESTRTIVLDRDMEGESATMSREENPAGPFFRSSRFFTVLPIESTIRVSVGRISSARRTFDAPS